MIEKARMEDPEYRREKERKERRKEERKDALSTLGGFFVLFLLPGILVFIATLD
jgi:hypothetical protein